jgi:hypothetical protein
MGPWKNFGLKKMIKIEHGYVCSGMWREEESFRNRLIKTKNVDNIHLL